MKRHNSDTVYRVESISAYKRDKTACICVQPGDGQVQDRQQAATTGYFAGPAVAGGGAVLGEGGVDIFRPVVPRCMGGGGVQGHRILMYHLHYSGEKQLN